jgi:hypothetical protein
MTTTMMMGAASAAVTVVLYSDWLQTGWSGDRIPVWAKLFAHVQSGPEVLPSLLYNEYRVYPGGKSARAWR